MDLVNYRRFFGSDVEWNRDRTHINTWQWLFQCYRRKSKSFCWKPFKFNSCIVFDNLQQVWRLPCHSTWSASIICDNRSRCVFHIQVDVYAVESLAHTHVPLWLNDCQFPFVPSQQKSLPPLCSGEQEWGVETNPKLRQNFIYRLPCWTLLSCHKKLLKEYCVF